MDLAVTNYDAETRVGSYFVANYPPFSTWKAEHVAKALDSLERPAPDPPVPLGLYIHIPFCRKRCRFCYFRVYTDKNARDVDRYVDALAREVALYARRPYLTGRQFDFVYFGGGTPSFLSSAQLRRLVDRIGAHWTWEHAREVTFECEPGTLTRAKLETIKHIGTTRLSLGIEHFDDDVLSVNGRAHGSSDCARAFDWARGVGFAQVNVDLIAGMVGDNEYKWNETVAKTLNLEPDSVTIYQMEVPHNTVLAQDAREEGTSAPIPDWPTKRAWTEYAFREFKNAGYEISSAYTLVKSNGPLPTPPRRGKESSSAFVYRDAIWHGADMVGTGVASFSYAASVHFQNEDGWGPYVERLARGELPLARAYPPTEHQRLVRELILQLKLGRVDAGYFRSKFGVEINEEFSNALQTLRDHGLLTIDGDRVTLTNDGLLRVDALLPHFFEPEHKYIRYT